MSYVLEGFTEGQKVKVLSGVSIALTGEVATVISQPFEVGNLWVRFDDGYETALRPSCVEKYWDR